MVSTGLTLLLVSLSGFVLVLWLVHVEKKRGKRLLLPGLRGWFDGVLATAGLRLVQTWDHFVKYILRLGWYYGLHSLLQATLRTLVSFYEKVEHVFETNRRRAKQLRAEKQHTIIASDTHLTEMARHKAETTLSPAQQKKLKDTQLEGE
jgi:hypothetical protein